MRLRMYILTSSIFIISCEQNSTKQKEHALKEKDSVISKTDNTSISTSTKTNKIEQVVKGKVVDN